jgi:hypothetical protein
MYGLHTSPLLARVLALTFLLGTMLMFVSSTAAAQY